LPDSANPAGFTDCRMSGRVPAASNCLAYPVRSTVGATSFLLRDQDKLCGAVASDATAWRVLDRVDDEHLTRLRTVRAAARERAWAAGAGPDLAAGLTIDIDATISIAHSEKENAAKTWKKTFGFHPLLAYLDRPDVSGGEALAGMLRPGKAGSNTAADHIDILTMAGRAAGPRSARPRCS
jgi:hypothetical protein